MAEQKRFSRRKALRTALVGTTGLAAAYLVGCSGDDNDEPQATATSTATGGPTGGVRTVVDTSTPAVPEGLSWRQIPTPASAPPPRHDHSVISDGQLLLVFGGRGEKVYSDLWLYDIIGGSWADASALGTPPPARFGHNAVYDATAHRMLVFGGQNDNTFFNDLWAYNLALGAWSQLDAGAASPAQRYGAASAIDPSGRLFVTHGFTDTGRFDDTWSLQLRDPIAWTDVSPASARPIERCLMRGVYDSSAGSLLMFGGQTTNVPFLGDLWAFRAASWTEITAEPKPSPRNFYSMAFDDASDRTMLFGGRTQDGPSNEFWFFTSRAAAWSQASPEGDAPSPRFGHDAAWLAQTRKLLVFGGRDETGDLNELWELTVPA